MYFIKQAIEELIGSYKGEVPLTHFLKQYFKAHPKLGSRDRRAISDAVYTYYRVARLADPASQNLWNLIHTGLALCGIQNSFLEKFLSGMETQTISLQAEPVFPDLAFSEGMSAESWQQSLFSQPLLFIRMRKNIPGIIQQLEAQGIAFERLGDRCLGIANSTQIDKILKPADYVVQDWSSQRSLDLLNTVKQSKAEGYFNVWDTCSGAGGKMLLLKDKIPEAAVLSTDIRASILHNLKERAQLYGHKHVLTRVLDSSNLVAVEKELTGSFDLVLSDVPCSGSGTWARTPEQFHFFDNHKVETFAQLQYNIALNASRKVKPGGYFLYITCSVFAAENEGVVHKLLEARPGLSLVQSQLINGIEDRADSMFAALFRNA